MRYGQGIFLIRCGQRCEEGYCRIVDNKKIIIPTISPPSIFRPTFPLPTKPLKHVKTIFDEPTRAGLINRIHTLSPNSTAQWGKMNVCQMVKHNILFEEMMLGKKQYGRVFIGRIFGKIALRSMVKDETPMQKNMPTVNGFGVTENLGGIPPETAQWTALVAEYSRTDQPYFVHPFFGNITRQQAGILVYKHIDHHLRQFGC